VVKPLSLVSYLGRLPPICMVVSKRCCVMPDMAILSIGQSLQLVMLSQFGSAVAKYLCCHATRQLLSAAAVAMKRISPQLVTDVLHRREGLADFQLVNSPETTFAAMVCCV